MAKINRSFEERVFTPDSSALSPKQKNKIEFFLRATRLRRVKRKTCMPYNNEYPVTAFSESLHANSLSLRSSELRILVTLYEIPTFFKLNF